MIKREFILLYVILFYCNISFGISVLDTVPERLVLARELCAIESEIYKYDREITLIRAVGGDQKRFEAFDLQQQLLMEEYDSLITKFQLAIHHNVHDFGNEAGRNAWFLVIQNFMHQRGIGLSVNERFEMVSRLPEIGGVSVKLREGNQDTSFTSYLIDSASYVLLNQYYPTWLESSFDQIIKLDVGIDVFLQLSRDHFIPFTAQTEEMNCGPTCLKMVLEQFGAYHSLEELAVLSSLDETGTSFGDLNRAAKQLNVNTENSKVSYDELMQEMERPVIVHWENRHFVVVYAMNEETVWVADPAWSRQTFARKDFCDSWLYGTEKTSGKGSVMTFQLTKAFYE